jgi:hypothetical protein
VRWDPIADPDDEPVAATRGPIAAMRRRSTTFLKASRHAED